jgi:hypothetical protein
MIDYKHTDSRWVMNNLNPLSGNYANLFHEDRQALMATFSCNQLGGEALIMNVKRQKSKLEKALEYLGDKWVFHPKNKVKRLPCSTS